MRPIFHHILLSALSLFLTLNMLGQGRIVFNGGANMVIENQGRVVIDNPNANGITNPGQGNVISEAEQDMIKWNIGTNTGIYTIPYQDNTGEEMDFNMEVVTAGSGSGYFLFSTYDGVDWNNLNYMPTDVTHMDDLAGGSTNNSDYVIDRFWIVDAEGYSTKPEPDMSFGYHTHELQTNGGNDPALTNEGDLRAQRFNNGTNEWGDLLPVGTNPGPNPVQDVQITPPDFFRSWTLVNKTSPLPVELLSFRAYCRDQERELIWKTASESNNDYFLLERSQDGDQYEVLDTVQGAGTTPVGADYSSLDGAADRGYYYRLVQVDMNGERDTLSTIVASSCEGKGDLQVEVRDNGGDRPILVLKNPEEKMEGHFKLYDGRGRVVQESEETFHRGEKSIRLDRSLERGTYFATIRTEKNLYTEKVLLYR